jgi:hypothetical protein
MYKRERNVDKAGNNPNNNEKSSAQTSGNNNGTQSVSSQSSSSSRPGTRSLFETLMGRDQHTASFYSQQKKNYIVGRTLGQLFTDSARVDASGEPPLKASEFNHIDLEEIDINLYRAKKEDLW